MIELEQVLPEEIERRSLEIITKELGDRTFPAGQEQVVKRVIHTTADFDYADSLIFSDGAVEKALEALREGCTIVTDTNMGKAGVNKKSLHKMGGEVLCFMADATGQQGRQPVWRRRRDWGATVFLLWVTHRRPLSGSMS